jgi:hypothetical protein
MWPASHDCEVAPIGGVDLTFQPPQGEYRYATQRRFWIMKVSALKRAMSSMERSVMTVEIGTTIGSAADLKLSPTAPDVAVGALCRWLEAALGSFCMVPSGTLRAPG